MLDLHKRKAVAPERGRRSSSESRDYDEDGVTAEADILPLESLVN